MNACKFESSSFRRSGQDTALRSVLVVNPALLVLQVQPEVNCWLQAKMASCHLSPSESASTEIISMGRKGLCAISRQLLGPVTPYYSAVDVLLRDSQTNIVDSW